MMLGFGRAPPSSPWPSWPPPTSLMAPNLFRANPLFDLVDPRHPALFRPPQHVVPEQRAVANEEHVVTEMEHVAKNNMIEHVVDGRMDDVAPKVAPIKEQMASQVATVKERWRETESDPEIRPTDYTSKSDPVTERLYSFTTTSSTVPRASLFSSKSRAQPRHVCPHPDCGYSSNRKNNLKRHVETMHERLSSPQLCCGLLFSHKAELKRHVRAAHLKGYICHICHKQFARKGLLDRHLKGHEGIKVHSCQFCQYASCHRSNLERHLRTHDHNRVDKVGQSKAMAKEETAVRSKE